MGIFRKLILKYEVPFYYYTKDTMSYDKKYFYNSTHMNKTAEEFFTRRLVSDFKRDSIFKNLFN